jgi:predicted metal-dependent hydrolase
VEQSEVQFGRMAIPYIIYRGRRQKTVAVGVDPIEGVRVRAPANTPVAKLDEIVHRKAKWIIDRRRRHEDLPPPPSPREFVSGETFLYLGRQYRLRLERGKAGEDVGVRLIGGHLHVPVHPGARWAGEVREQLVAWYRAHADQRLPERVAVWAPRLGVEPARVLIRDQRKRCGSADAKSNVRFNWRVVQAPMRLVDYVVAHELVHLRYPDHTRGFWAALGQVMSDYEERREALRRLGRVMIW